jgi:cobalamin-dependent methionine synthase I
MLPDESQHAHHKLSCLFTLEVLQELKQENKKIPILLGGTESYEKYTHFQHKGYENLSRTISKQTILNWNLSQFVKGTGN